MGISISYAYYFDPDSNGGFFTWTQFIFALVIIGSGVYFLFHLLLKNLEFIVSKKIFGILSVVFFIAANMTLNLISGMAMHNKIVRDGHGASIDLFFNGLAIFSVLYFCMYLGALKSKTLCYTSFALMVVPISALYITFFFMQ